MLLDRVRQVLERQRLLLPESEWPERVLEALAGCLREGSPRRVELDEPGVGPRNPGCGGPLQQDFRDTTSYGVLSGSRQGKDRPFRANQERRRLRNQEMRSTASNGSSHGVYPGCSITLIPSWLGSRLAPVTGWDPLFTGLPPGQKRSGGGIRTPGQRSAAVPAASSPPAAHLPDGLSHGSGSRRAH